MNPCPVLFTSVSSGKYKLVPPSVKIQTQPFPYIP